ncbi:MAG: bifunctional DNA primase/polymerase [Labedaea sp.]
MSATRDENLLAAALAAAQRGWHVFPIRPHSKKPPALHGDTTDRPCPRTGGCRDGHHGWEQRATTDPDRIQAAWNGPFTGCNIGIATGPSGLLVLDLDTVHSPDEVVPDGWNRRGIRHGRDVFTALCQQAQEPVPDHTTTVTTPRGGTHLYFTAPTTVQLRNTEGESGNGLGWKVDTRAWGGYVVAPGSITPDGIYTLTDDRPPMKLPAWLVHLLTPRPSPVNSAPSVVAAARLDAYVAAAVRGECDRVCSAQPTRHTRTLFSAAGNLGQLIGAGTLPPVTAEQALYTAAQHMITGTCQCTEREVRRTITNGLRAGAARPRTLPTQGPPPPAAITGLFDQAGAA